MPDRIYIRTNGKMEEFEEQPFPDEDAIQRLIAEHPVLIGGGRITPGDPRRWILIRREQGVPDAIDAADRWAVDVLLIDQDATPTVVEIKRGSNTQLRREVVGQLLEYAANASHVRVDGLREAFEDQEDWEGKLRTLLQSEDNPDSRYLLGGRGGTSVRRTFASSSSPTRYPLNWPGSSGVPQRTHAEH